MNELNGVPLDAITRGRSLEDVLSEYMRIWGDAQRVADSYGKDPDEVFADTMKLTAYRIYLLGVEDGMKETNT